MSDGYEAMVDAATVRRESMTGVVPQMLWTEGCGPVCPSGDVLASERVVVRRKPESERLVNCVVRVLPATVLELEAVCAASGQPPRAYARKLIERGLREDAKAAAETARALKIVCALDAASGGG